MAKIINGSFLYSGSDEYNHTGRHSVCQVLDSSTDGDGEILVRAVVTAKKSSSKFLGQEYRVDPIHYREAVAEDWKGKPYVLGGFKVPVTEPVKMYLKGLFHSKYSHIGGADLDKPFEIGEPDSHNLYSIFFVGQTSKHPVTLTMSEIQKTKPRSSTKVKFSVGQVVVAKVTSSYSHTGNHALCLVTAIAGTSFTAKVIGTSKPTYRSSLGDSHKVESKHFTLAKESDWKERPILHSSATNPFICKTELSVDKRYTLGGNLSKGIWKSTGNTPWVTIVCIGNVYKSPNPVKLGSKKVVNRDSLSEYVEPAFMVGSFIIKDKVCPNTLWKVLEKPDSLGISKVQVVGVAMDHLKSTIGDTCSRDLGDYRLALSGINTSHFKHFRLTSRFLPGTYIVRDAPTAAYIWKITEGVEDLIVGGFDKNDSHQLASTCELDYRDYRDCIQSDFDKVVFGAKPIMAKRKKPPINSEKVSTTKTQTNPIKSNKKVHTMKTTKTTGLAQKMINRMFKKVDGVKLDFMSGNIGLERDGSIFTIQEVEKPELKDGESEKPSEYYLSENLFAEMAMDMPAFAQATPLNKVQPRDLVLDQAGNVMGWATSATDKSIKIIKPNGQSTTYSPSKVEMMGGGRTVMVISSMMTGNMNSMMPMLMLMQDEDGDDSGGMKDMMMPLMMMQMGGQGQEMEGGMNPMMMMMMLGKESGDSSMKEMLPMMMMMGGGMGGQPQGQQHGGMMGGMNPMMMMMMLKK